MITFLIILLILVVMLGFELTILLKLNLGLPERLSVSYLLGIGIFTFIVFLIDYFLNLNFSLANTFIILIFTCVIFLGFAYRGMFRLFRNIRFRRPVLKFNRRTLFWGFILGLFGYTLLANVFWPISDWDALALYDFRARVFLIDTNLIHAAISNIYFLTYPLLTSLAHLFVYQIGFSNPKFIYSLFYLSFVVIFYYSLRRNVSENKAMFFTVVASIIPEVFTHSMKAYTNLPYAVYLACGIFYLYEWIKNKRISYILLSAILVGLSSWVRSTEPFWGVPLFAVFLFALITKNWKAFIYYLVIIFAFRLPWNMFENYINASRVIPSISNNPSLSYFGIIKSIRLDGLLHVTSFVYNYVFSTWGLAFMGFVLIASKAMFDWKRKSTQFLYMILLFYIVLFAGTVVFSIGYPEWDTIPDSARRMSIFLLPLMIYSIALNAERRHNEQKK